jgi:hypothetical protein
MPVPQSRLGREAQTARSDNKLVELAPSQAQEGRREREAAATAEVSEKRTPAPPAAPAPSASVEAFRGNTDALSARTALNETVVVVIDSVSPGNPQIHWRSRSGTDVERSTDGGQTWIKTVSSPPGPITAIRAVDALNAAVTTSDGRTFSTTDGGTTWVPVQEKPPAPF